MSVLCKDRELRALLGVHLNEMRKCSQLCDWILIANDNDHPFPVHKAILIAACPFFEELFEKKEIQTSRENSLQEYKIFGYNEEVNQLNSKTNCEPNEGTSSTMPLGIEHLDRLLEYIYTGVIEIKYSELFDIWKDANIFKLQSLKSFCLKTALSNMTKENCWREWKTYGHLDKDLDEKIAEFVLDNAEYILETEAVEDLEFEEIERLVNKNKTFTNIDARYLFLEKWVSCNFDKRRNELDKLLKYFDFKEFTEEFFRDKVLYNHQFKQSNSFLRKIIESMNNSPCENNIYLKN